MKLFKNLKKKEQKTYEITVFCLASGETETIEMHDLYFTGLILGGYTILDVKEK